MKGKGLTAAGFLIAFFSAEAMAQVEIFPKPWGKPELWSTDTLWVGASFTRSSFDPVTVSLKGNGAGWSGDLFFIDPKTGIEDRLFSNHDPVGTTVVLSDRHDIPIGDTLYFVYRVTEPAKGDYPSPASILPKYTGPNIPGQSRYVATPTNPKYGHRWSVAGRVNDSLVEFGFEDNVEPTNSDYDFDDIVFRTTLSLLGDETQAHLAFTDQAGSKLADGALYSPANDTLYLVYTDDYAGGNIRKDVVVRVKNRHGTAAPDSETVSVLPLRRDGNTGTWIAKLPIDEAAGIPGDGKAQVYYLGEVTAAVKTHNRAGLPDGGTAGATLNVAYPDKPETVKVRPCQDTAGAIDRITPCVEVRVADQSFTRKADTVWAEVRCDQSGDVLARVRLIEQGDGAYKSEGIPKGEGPIDPSDGKLSCKASDNITVTYVDEIYGNRVTAKAAWSGQAPEALFFAKVGDFVTPITSIKEGADGNGFQIVAKGPSPTVGAKDTLLITVTTDQGDKEILAAVETDVNSNVYAVPAAFVFQSGPPAAGNGRIEAYPDPAKAANGVVATASAIIDGKPFTATLSLIGNPLPSAIESMRGYPPVAGLDPNRPGFAIGNEDPHGRGAFSTRKGSEWIVDWIPPADWPAGYVPGSSVYAPENHAPGDPVRPGVDAGAHGPMPLDIGTVQVISTGEYVAEFSIYDNLGNWVKDARQAFGYRGELANIQRKAENGKGLVSFLVWDLKDSRGRKAGTGAYVWKIRFLFRNGKHDIRYVRTGVTRSTPK